MERGGKRRGHRGLITLLVIIFVIIGLAVIVDRVAVNAAESRIATEVKKELDRRNIATVDEPRVSIAGFPFLTQVIDGKYRKISVDVLQPKASEIQFERIKLDVRTVHADLGSVMSGTGRVTAERITGTATLGWDAVREALVLSGVPSVIDPATIKISIKNNKIRMEFPVAAAGLQTTAQVTGDLALVQGEIRLKVETVELANGTATPSVQRLIDQMRDQLTGTVKIPQLPYSLAIDKLETRAADVLIVASTRDIALAG